MRTRNLILAAISLLLITGASFAQDNAELNATGETIPCPIGVISGFDEVEGETVECGTVTVPLDYEKPDGVQIELVYGILKAQTLSPAPDPVIYLHGGPGSSELSGLTGELRERFSTLRLRRDVVVFDQRGTGFSPGETDCSPTYASGYDAALEHAQGESGDMDADALKEAYNILQADCTAALNENGVDLTHYNTINNARDVATLAAALGYDTFNLYGLSYGTKLGQEVIRQNPPGLRSVILDSVVTPSIKAYERMPEAYDTSFLNIYEMCLADDACAKAYPDLIERLNALFEQVDQEPIVLEDGGAITSKALATMLSNSANMPRGVWQLPYFPRLIHELEQGVADTWISLNGDTMLPEETVAYFKAPSEEISYTASQLLDEANNLARQSGALDDTARVIAAEAFNLIKDADTTPSSVFLRTLNELRETPHNAFADYGYRTDFVSLPLQETTQAVLEEFIGKHFSGLDAEILLDIVSGMEEEDIQELYSRIQSTERLANQVFEVLFALHLYVCNEDVPYNTIEGLQEYAENYRIPGLTRDELDKTVKFLEGCEAFPTGTAPESFHEPVTGGGSVPIMVFTGTNDTQTATIWGEQAAKDLVGSQYVSFPNAGHGAIKFSQCAKDVAAAFLDNPDAEVDTSCTADLVPRFVLPDAPLIP